MRIEMDTSLRLELSDSEGDENGRISGHNHQSREKEKTETQKRPPDSGQPLITKFTTSNSQDEEEGIEKEISWHHKDLANSTPYIAAATTQEDLEKERALEESSILLMLNENEENTTVNCSKGPIADLLTKWMG
jgi:uncharacterized protein with gpF-like domain